MIGALCLLAAQAAASPEPPRFAEETVVTAERAEGPRADTPAALSVLGREEIRRLPVETLAGLLDHVPGVQVLFGEGYGLVPMVQSRGFFAGGEAEYVQLLVDGVPVADVESGLADWRRIRAADIDRVEVLHGPGSALYGDTALGGVVQVFTRATGTDPVREAGLSVASFGSLAADAAWRGVLGGLRAGAHASGARTGGFRAHSATDEAAADLSLASVGDAPRLSLTLSGSGRDREDPGPLDRDQLGRDRFSSDRLFRFDREETRRGRVALAIQRDGGDLRYRALVHGSARDTRFLRTLLLAAGIGDRALRDVDTRAVGVTLEAERSAGGRGRARIGVDVSRERAHTGYRAVDEDGVAGSSSGMVSARRERLGAFAAADWRVSRRVRLASGLRWDGIADDAGPELGGRLVRSAWSPRAGVSVRVGPDDGTPVSVFLQASRAFKAPTLDQLADPRPFPDFGGGTFTISNPRLEPQRAVNVEAGLSRHGARAWWDVVFYRMTVADEIDFDPATFRYANVGSSLHRGVEASVRLFQGRRLAPHLAYVWTRVGLRDPAAADRQLKNIPKHVLRAGLTARLPGAVTLEARGEWMGRRFLDDANAYPLRSAALVDGRVQRTFGRVRARIDATNLAARDWEAVGYALPDLEGRPVPYVFPGTGRAVRAGVDIAF